MDNNYLFLAMQTGGQLSPEQLQRAQQMGQLPQMGMGAGLTDIQKMNMQQAEHYGMFRRGGVPRKYAQGGEQEEIDQQYMSPYVEYNQRVSEFLENLKSTAMGALQDEMVGVNDDYAQEADEIETEQAQYGRQVSAPTLNPTGLNAVNAWMGAAQNTKDITTPLAQTAGLASGLKGYFGGDQASYEANPYNGKFNPTRLTVTDKQTGEKTVTRAGRDGFNYGGQYFQPGGEKLDEAARQAQIAASAFDEAGDLKPGYTSDWDIGFGGNRLRIIGPDGKEFIEPQSDYSHDANGNLKPGYVTFTGVPEPMAGAPMTPFSGIGGLASQVAGLVRTGKTISDLLPSPSATSTGVGPFTGNVGAPATASGTPTFGGITPNFYSAGMQGAKSQWATDEAMNAYGEKARTDEAVYNAQQAAAQAQKTEVEQNAIKMGWVNPDGSADVAGYSAPGPDGKRWGYKPGFNPNATNQSLPTSTKKKETGTKGGGSKGAGTSGGSGTAGTTGTVSTPPTGTEVVKNADGTESSLSPEEAAKRKADAAAQAGKVVDPGKTPAATTTTPAAGTTPATTTTQPKTGTGEIDYLASLADPTGQNSGGVYRTDRNGNPVPMAFYDPNMHLNRMSADYRNNAASWFRKNKKPGQMKSLTFDFSSDHPYTVPGEKAAPQANGPAPIMQSPNVNDTTGAKEVTGLTTNPQFDMNWRGNQQRPMYPAPAQNVPANRGPVTSMNDLVPNGVEVGPQGNVPPNLSTSIKQTAPLQVAQQAPLTERQKRQLDRINARTQRKVGNIQNDTPGTKASHKYGGQYFQPGGQNEEGSGVLSNPMTPSPNDNFFETGLLPQQEESNYMSPALPGETVIEHDKYMRAKYDKNKKNNPFFAPAMMAGLNTLAGAAQNMDAKKKENQLRSKLSYDQIYSANPQTSGNQGDWTSNEGYFRPNDMVPTQFTGNGPLMQNGGAYSEGDELYLDEDTIQAFLNAGGQLDYLD